MSLFSYLKSQMGQNQHRRNARRSQKTSESALVEQLENRALLSAQTPLEIASLSDEFDDSASIDDWQRVNEVEGWNTEQLNIWDVDQTQNGRMVMQPHTVVWYENWRGPMVFKEVTGDFVITTEVHVTDRDDIGNSDADNIPSDGQYSLGGVMVRTPRDITDPSQWTPGSQQDDGTNNGENYVFLSFGYAFSNEASQFGLELKTTRNSNSQLEVRPMGVDVNTVIIQTARIGDTIITMYQRPGEDWQVRSRHSRPDMPETLQVGLVTYTDWGKASDFDPFVHNGSVLVPGAVEDPSPLEPFNPDLTAGFEYARFAAPEIPVELQGADLTDPAVTDEQLLSFLGDHANHSPDGSADSAVVSVSALTDRLIEGAGGGEGFLISRDGGSIDQPLMVNFILEGDAVYGSDYSATSVSSVVIPAGAESVSIDLQTIDDAEEETVEEVRLRLLTGTGYTTDAAYQATVQIRDDDTTMSVGTNLSRNVDWDAAWIFKDAFLRSRPWRAMAVNTQTGQQVWQHLLDEGPDIQVDEDGWVTELPAWTAEDGTDYQQTVRTTLFSAGVPRPVGIYRVEWDGTGDLQMAYVVESGVTADGRNYALVDMPVNPAPNYVLTIASTDPTDPVRNINFWMPDYNGESLVTPDWQPGAATSPFHPAFIERLSGFETIRFMDWQATNYNGELDLWEERTLITDASQANMTGDFDTIVSGIALEYMIELANELGASPWFNMPHQANDDFVQNFATTVRDSLDPDLDVYVEWSNELWNSHFPTFHWVVNQMSLPENDGRNFFQVVTSEIRNDFQIWSDVFAGQNERLTRIVAGQQNNPWVMSQLLASMDGEFDAISSTAYYGLSADFIAAASESTTADEIIDSLLNDSLPAISERLRVHQSIAEQYSTELGREIEYLTYESGSHVFEYNTALFGSPAEAAGVEAMYSPRMYDVYEVMLNEVRDIGIDLYNEFIFTGPYGASPYGNYGLLHNMEQPIEQAHQYRALLDFIDSQDQPTAVPTVSIELNDAVGSEQGDDILWTFHRTDEALDSELAVDFSLSGSAESGLDYSTSAAVVYFAPGESTAFLGVTPIDDSLVEGVETVIVQLADSDNYQLSGVDVAEATIEDDDYQLVADQEMSHLDEVLTVELPATHPDGTSLEYAAVVVVSELYQLDQQFDFHTTGNYYQDYHGAEERWIRGDGSDWFYLLPSGELGRWENSFADSPIIAQLSPAVYENPQLLVNVVVPATVSVVNHQLVIAPVDGFLGEFAVELTTTNGTTSQTQQFSVSVVNEAPVISHIPDQVMERNGAALIIPVSAFDPDGADVNLTVAVVDEVFQLNQTHGFHADGGYYTNHAGLQEKWIRSQDNRWHYILPGGELYRWNGGFEQSELLADLDGAVYEDPALLIEAEPIPIDVSLDGSDVLIDSVSDFVGEFQVRVQATDGTGVAVEEFSVQVTNEVPILNPFNSHQLAAGDSLAITLNGSDNNGDELAYSAVVQESVEYELNQEHGFYSDGDFYTNWGGQQEKWIRSPESGLALHSSQRTAVSMGRKLRDFHSDCRTQHRSV